jgi:hypothetical protein
MAVNPSLISERRRTAYHESAHCIAALKLKVPFTFVTIVGDGERSGFVRHPPSPDRHTHLDAAILHLSGVCAEARLLHLPVAAIVLDVAACDLLAAARALAQAPPPRTDLGTALNLTRELIDQRWPQIQLIADELLNSPSGTLSADQVSELLRRQQQGWEWRSLRF